MIDAACTELEPLTSTKTACDLLGKSRATLYRQRNPAPAAAEQPSRAIRPAHPAELAEAERAALLAVLNSEWFVDRSPAQVWAILLDEGVYLASVSTMYRLLRAHDATRERRAQATHPAKNKPELLADGPNQVWTWDIERHEAPRNRVGVRDRHRRLVAAGR